MTPQEQAEAMARELLHSRIHSKTKFEDTLATALSKLIAENERLKKAGCEHCGSTRIITDCPACGAPNCCQTCCQLTATEAKLSEAMTFIEHLSKEKRWSVEHSEMRSTRHAILALGFLSTLTADRALEETK